MLDGRTIAIAGCVLSALAVGLGAFGAHGLKESLAPESLETWNTGVLYLGWHALGIILVGVLAELVEAGMFPAAGGLFLAGIVLFCGSLFALSLGAPRWFGAVAPLGGLSFIAGWLLAAIAVWQAFAR